MGYKLKTHSGAAKRFKKTGSSVKSRSANRNHILTKQSTKRKRHNRGLNKLTGTVLKMASALIRSCLLYTSPSPRDATLSRMPSSA